jgi:hypothetical protein
MCGCKIIRRFATTEKFLKLANRKWWVTKERTNTFRQPYIKDGSFHLFGAVACTGVPLDATFISASGYYMQRGNRFHELKQGPNYFNDRLPIHFDYDSSPNWIVGIVEQPAFDFTLFQVKETGTSAKWWNHHLGYIDQSFDFETHEKLQQQTETKKWRFLERCGAWGDEMIEADSDFIGYIERNPRVSPDQQYLYVFLAFAMQLPVAVMTAFQPNVFSSPYATWFLVFSTVTVELNSH